MLGDLILNAYQHREVIDLASDDNDEDLPMEQEWVVLDEFHEDD